MWYGFAVDFDGAADLIGFDSAEFTHRALFAHRAGRDFERLHINAPLLKVDWQRRDIFFASPRPEELQPPDNLKSHSTAHRAQEKTTQNA
jgi:hypothetical protein